MRFALWATPFQRLCASEPGGNQHEEQAMDRQAALLAPIDEALVERVRDRIARACHPEAIYLFGSAARGDVRPGSDLDLLVVMNLPDGGRPHEKAAELHSLFRGWLVPLDIVVRTPEQFERGQRMPGFVERTALREGRLLYEAERDRV